MYLIKTLMGDITDVTEVQAIVNAANKAWMDLKKLRDNGMISKEDFKKRKAEIFE